MTNLNAPFQAMSVAPPPATDLGCAIKLLTQTDGLTLDDVMVLADYLTANLNEAVTFSNFTGMEYRALWAQRKLSIIRGN